MYSLMRRIHAFSGIILLLWVVMFFVSGLLIAYSGRIPATAPEPTTEVIAVDFQGPATAESLVAHFRSALGVRGRSRANRLEAGGWRIEFVLPSRLTQITVSDSLGQATVTSTPRHWKAKLVQLHRLHGYGGGVVFGVWALLYDVASLAMIAFPVSGIYLWYRRTPDRRLGWIVLTVSLGLMVGVTVSLIITP